MSPFLDGTDGWGGSPGGGGPGGSSGAGGGGPAGGGGGPAGSGGGSGGGSGAGASGGGGGAAAWSDIWTAEGFWDGNTGSEGRAELTNLDVGVGDGAVWNARDKLDWVSRGGGASTTGDTRSRRVSIDRVWGIEPQEMGSEISPDRESQNVSALEGLSHILETTVNVEVRVVTEDGLLVDAELISDGVEVTDTGPFVLGLKDDFATLNPGTTDLDEVTGGGPVVSDELGDDSDLGVGVDSLSWTVEFLVTLTERVEITAVLVADTVVSVATVTALGFGTASVETSRRADVWGVGVGDGVGLPDIHLVTAGTVLAETSVGVDGGCSPSFSVTRTSDELHVVWALSIAVTGTVLGTSLVGWVLGHTTVLVHLDKVQGSVDTARGVGDIDIKGELLTDGVEHVVVGVVLQQVDTRTNVGSRRSGHELQGDSIAAGGDTVGTGVIGALKSAVSSARGVVWAEGAVELVAGVAVVELVGSIVSEPTPVGVDDDLGVLGGTAARASTGVRGQRRMGLSSDGPRLLGRDVCDEGGEKSDLAECRHCECVLCANRTRSC